MRKTKFFSVVAAIAMIFTAAGCQDFFTWAPFSGIETNPSTLSTDKLIAYSWDVMASGNRAKMTDVLNAVDTAFAKDSTNGNLAYAGANLAVSLSNAATLFISPPPKEITDPVDPVALTAYADAYKTNISVTNLEDAADFYTAAHAAGISLNATDYYMLCLGNLLAANGDSFDNIEAYDSDPANAVPPGVPNPLPAQEQTYFDDACSMIGPPLEDAWKTILEYVFFVPIP
jgi:hypothetical protein